MPPTKKQKMLVWLETMICVSLAFLIYYRWATGRSLPFLVEAQDKQSDVAPYLVSNGIQNADVYKLVHQGCELFVVVGHGAPWTVAVATGRGCK